MPNSLKLKKEISELMKKPEMWMGITVVLVVIVFSTIFIVKKVVRKNPIQKTVTEKIISPVVTITPEATPSATNKLQTVVKKLADTKGEVEYQVKDNDNYWKISEAVCGTGKYFENVQILNQDQDLQPGNTIKVVCE